MTLSTIRLATFPQISLCFSTNLFRFASEGSDSLFSRTVLKGLPVAKSSKENFLAAVPFV